MSLPSNATLKVLPFKVNIADSCVEELKTLLKLSKLPPPTYEGTQTNMGVTRQWVADTKEQWANEFDWSVAGSHCTDISNLGIDLYDLEGGCMRRRSTNSLSGPL